MRFGYFIESNMRKIVVEKSYRKCAGETIPRPVSKKSKLSISLDQYGKVLKFVSVVCQFKGYRNIVKSSSRLLAFT